jgi:hypothetical protein
MVRTSHGTVKNNDLRASEKLRPKVFVRTVPVPRFLGLKNKNVERNSIQSNAEDQLVVSDRVRWRITIAGLSHDLPSTFNFYAEVFADYLLTGFLVCGAVFFCLEHPHPRTLELLIPLIALSTPSARHR